MKMHTCEKGRDKEFKEMLNATYNSKLTFQVI
jgi:hypothetical protein